MADFEIIAGLAGFMIISHIILVTGGGGEYLFEVDAEPPQLIPAETDVGFNTFDLEEDVFRSENITFAEYGDLSDPDYSLGEGLGDDSEITNDTKVAVLESGKDSGRLEYSTPGVSSVEALFSKDCGNLFEVSRMTIVSDDPSDTPDHVCGVVEANVESDLSANYVIIEFEPDTATTGGEPALYMLRWSKQRQNYEPGGGSLLSNPVGALAGGLDNLGQLVTYPARLWGYFSHFPFYFRIFYGAILAYLSITIIRGL